MDIHFHSHHADVSSRLQDRAEQGILRLARRVGNLVRASVRFQEDGPTRRVEVALHAPGGRHFIAEAKGRYFGPALSQALVRMGARLHRTRRAPRTRARQMARA